MVTIKIGKKKVKVFNLMFLILILVLFIYLIGCLIFMLPVFKSSYNYKDDNGNYLLDANTTFKTRYLSCYIIEKVKVVNKDDLIYEKVTNDLIGDGYKNKKDNVYIRKTKINKFCKAVKKEYEKVHSKSYITFKLNGNYTDIVNYNEEYKDLYVQALKNDEVIKDIDVSSNYNENKVGSYIISYTIKLNDYYNKRLYRVLEVIDNQKPIINLIGDNKITINYGETYIEPGFNATDNYDGDISKKVKIKNSVDTKKSGNYKITYTISDSSGNKTKAVREVVVNEKEEKVVKQEPKMKQKDGITYVNGILLVNKKYSLPKDYDPGVNKEALKQLKKMQADASALGLDLSLISGYRSYKKQTKLYNSYVKQDGEEKASMYSAKPGHSEHQTGLAFDIGKVEDSFKNTNEAKWIEENAHLYGFIVRYPKNKTDITGYIYEPWHVRYLGIDIATKVKESGLCLEEYLEV